MEIKRQRKSLTLSFHLLVSGGLNTGHLVWQQVSSPVDPFPQLGRNFVLPTPVVLVQCRGWGGADWFSWRVQSFTLGMNMVTGHIRCLPEDRKQINSGLHLLVLCIQPGPPAYRMVACLVWVFSSQTHSRKFLRYARQVCHLWGPRIKLWCQSFEQASLLEEPSYWPPFGLIGRSH